LLKNDNTIFNIASKEEFLSLSLEIFRAQYQKNKVYRLWVDALKIDPFSVTQLEHIPFLPIEFFKNHEVVTEPINARTAEFISSSTTSQIPSKHFVTDITVYERSFLKCFNRFYGHPSEYCFLALLPNYLQRKGSSLVYMCKRLIEESKHPSSGFFLDDMENLASTIQKLKNTSQKVFLIGVSYALMDLCDAGIRLNSNFIVLETGGMKGTRKELLKPELHAYLKKGFGIESIHSEYGMTELLSQAYSRSEGLFEWPPWMGFLIREVDDPLKIRKDNKTGGINVIDLANIHSCSFIATKDLGRITKNNKLELMGRYDNSDVRGCNLMLEGSDSSEGAAL
jgi:phenylacetate-coenzyme A ligase PaaK-like adenylate-forming protein